MDKVIFTLYDLWDLWGAFYEKLNRTNKVLSERNIETGGDVIGNAVPCHHKSANRFLQICISH